MTMHASAQLIATYQALEGCALRMQKLGQEQRSRRILFGAAARDLRIERFGARSLRTIARRLNISPAFLCQLEAGDRWSDDIAHALKELLINAPFSSGETTS